MPCVPVSGPLTWCGIAEMCRPSIASPTNGRKPPRVFSTPHAWLAFGPKRSNTKNAFRDLSGLLPSNAQMAPYLSGWSGKESGSAASEHTGTAHA